MLPIEKLSITKTKQKDGSLFIQGRFLHDQIKVMTSIDQRIGGMEEFVEKKMRMELWETAYNDLRAPLSELMVLARYVSRGNPAAYPEEARIGELTKEISELLDWKKHLAAKREKKTE